MFNILMFTNPSITEMQQSINRQPGMNLVGASADPTNIQHQLNVHRVRLLLIFPERAGLSLSDTQHFLDSLLPIDTCPIVVLCTDYRELASHEVCTYWLPQDTGVNIIVNRIRTLCFPCGTPEERMQVESMLLNFGLLPGQAGFRYLRDTITLCLHAPAGSNPPLSDIFRDVAALRNASLKSVSEAIRFSAKRVFTNGLATVMKYSPETCRNLKRSGRTVPSNLNFVRMFMDLLAPGSRSRTDAAPAVSRKAPKSRKSGKSR